MRPAPGPSRASLVLSVTAVLWAVAGCEVFDASLLDGGADGRVDGEAGMDGGECTGKTPPPRPDVEDGESVDEVIFAVRDVRLDQSMAAWKEIGFDLDGLCSYAPEPEVECVSPVGSLESDGDNGIDNSLGHNILQLVDVAFGGSLQEDQRDVMTIGRGVVLMRLRDWNGTANDPQVDAAFAQSAAGAAAQDNGSPPDGEVVDSIPVGPGGEELPAPEWDGTDWFWAREDAFVGGNLDVPRVRDEDAYMVDGQLVMRFSERTAFIFSGIELGLIVQISDLDMTMQLSDDLQSVEVLEAGGRWALEDIYATAEKAGVCPGTGEYRAVVANLEDAVDVMADPGEARSGEPCDALSVGMTFESGVRANILDVAPVKELVSVCTMDGGVPDGGADAGSDGGVIDAGSDAGATDAGSDAGAAEAGTDAGGSDAASD